MPKPPNIPSPDAIRRKLKRIAAKQGAASLAREMNLPYDTFWNYIAGRTNELRHTDLVKCLKFLVTSEAEKTPKP